ncbi:MAG TPA: type II secretion system protein [Candidatus Paceibacterota bacterium]|nr:type II secretion system protein [Candidatus Paceibacterota bacterium]
MKSQRAYAAFTLIELLVVIAIIGILTAILAPTLTSFRKGDAMAAGTSQLLGGVSRARQLAISQHTDVYMVFLTTNFWQTLDWSPSKISPAEKVAVTNLSDKQLTGYAFVSFRSVGDQPGQRTFRYLSSWHVLPESIFIPEYKFLFRDVNVPNPVITDTAKGATYKVYGFDRINVPFPNETSGQSVSLPCIAFDYQGKLLSQPPGGEDAEYIPLAHGGVSYSRNPETKVLTLGPAGGEERPASNSISAYNLVRVDWLTGRSTLERKEMQ